MKEFIYYAEGPEKEITVAAATQKEAHKKAWESLTSEEQNITSCLDWIDEKEMREA